MASRLRMLSGFLRPATAVKPCHSLRHVTFLKSTNCAPQSSFLCIRHSSSNADSKLVDFLQEEIKAETDLARQRHAETPSITGFTVNTDDAAVVLEKGLGNEKVLVKFNVNHTVDIQPTSGAMDERQPAESTQGEDRIESKPNFSVEVCKGDQRLVFECSFPDMQFEDDSPETDEVFSINEIFMYSGEISEKVFAVDGNIVDENLYDYFLSFLQDRGIDHQFATELVQFATHYEHAQYVSLLQKIRAFVAK